MAVAIKSLATLRLVQILFAVSDQVLAGPANRFPHYGWVVSYRGSGWVPTIFLAHSTPPAKAEYHFSKHFVERASDRMRPGSKCTSSEAVDIINDPSTILMATWSSEPDRPASPRLHHYNPNRGTVVTDLAVNPRPLHCITFLAKGWRTDQWRMRAPGVLAMSPV